MSLLFWGITVGMLGKVLLGVAVLRVHMGILHEHHIDGIVLESIKRERWVTVIGLALIVLGYFIEVVFYGYTPLLTCTGGECAAMLGGTIGGSV